MSLAAPKLAPFPTPTMETAMNQAPLTPRPAISRIPRRPRAERQPESMIELLTRDLEAWRLAKGVITKARESASRA